MSNMDVLANINRQAHEQTLHKFFAKARLDAARAEIGLAIRFTHANVLIVTGAHGEFSNAHMPE